MPKIGDKIKMEREKQRYTIRALDERYVILTKPFNARKTYLYTIVDLERKDRGACNLIFGLPCDVNTPESAAEALEMLKNGEMEVSYRNCLPLEDSELQQLGVSDGLEAKI
jgi:hypothetical protein